MPRTAVVESFSPTTLPHRLTARKIRPSVIPGCLEPRAEGSLDPVRDGDGADPPGLARDVDEDRPAVALLEVRDREAHELAPAERAADERGEDGPVALPLDRRRVR